MHRGDTLCTVGFFFNKHILWHANHRFSFFRIQFSQFIPLQSWQDSFFIMFSDTYKSVPKTSTLSGCTFSRAYAPSGYTAVFFMAASYSPVQTSLKKCFHICNLHTDTLGPGWKNTKIRHLKMAHEPVCNSVHVCVCEFALYEWYGPQLNKQVKLQCIRYSRFRLP